MDNHITVTGQGNVHIVPDVTRLQISLVSLHDSYEDAYVQAKQNTDRLTNIMKEVKLAPSLPKTIKLDIEKKTQSEYDRYNHYTGEKFLGFELNHKIKIDLGIDNVLLNTIVRLIGKQLKQAEINIGYTVRDARPAQLLMLERAVKDAKAKAEIMAKACGCQLGEVNKIDYSFNELHIYSEARNIHNASEACCCEPGSLDITPDDLAISDRVDVTWSLINPQS